MNITEVFATQDVGELLGVKSFLESHGLRVYSPNYHAESMALWTAGIGRTFTLHVAGKEISVARKLLKQHISTQLPSSESYREKWRMFGFALLVVVVGWIIIMGSMNATPR